MFLGAFLATNIAIEFNSNSVASNKLFGVVNPCVIMYRIVWALNPQRSRASSMVVDRLPSWLRSQKMPIKGEKKRQVVRQQIFQK
jgi:hypothetical protein